MLTQDIVRKSESVAKEVFNLVFSERAEYRNDLQCYWLVRNLFILFKMISPKNKSLLLLYLTLALLRQLKFMKIKKMFDNELYLSSHY